MAGDPAGGDDGRRRRGQGPLSQPGVVHAYRSGFTLLDAYQKLRDAITGHIRRQNSKVSLPALDLVAQLRKLARKNPSFAAVSRACTRGAHWTHPVAGGEITFATWTSDGILHHSSFDGLRVDKLVKDVKLELPAKTG